MRTVTDTLAAAPRPLSPVEDSTLLLAALVLLACVCVAMNCLVCLAAAFVFRRRLRRGARARGRAKSKETARLYVTADRPVVVEASGNVELVEL